MAPLPSGWRGVRKGSVGCAWPAWLSDLERVHLAGRGCLGKQGTCGQTETHVKGHSGKTPPSPAICINWHHETAKSRTSWLPEVNTFLRIFTHQMLHRQETTMEGDSPCVQPALHPGALLEWSYLNNSFFFWFSHPMKRCLAFV